MERYEGWTQAELVARIQELEAAKAASLGKGQIKVKKASKGEAQVLDAVRSSSSGEGQLGAEETARKSASSSAPTTSSPSHVPGPSAAAPSMGQESTATDQDTAAPQSGSKKKERRVFDVSDLPVRKIALRFAYDGANYSGLASQGDGIADSISSSRATNILPTVEALLWNALCTARLVDPTKGMSGAGWSRCGRTDRGVSAAGQVVALWVRSCKVDERHLKRQEDDRLEERERQGQMRWLRDADDGDVNADAGVSVNTISDVEINADGKDAGPDGLADTDWSYGASTELLQPGVHGDADELPYVVSLNRLLPSSIRVLGWSPVRADFNARFDCRYRHYKYFFTSGPPEQVLAPSHHVQERNHAASRMNIPAMREAASYLLGEHDFRNLCKLDPSKQIKNFRRRIDGVSIDKVENGWPAVEATSTSRSVDASATLPHAEDMYVLNLRGTAFLYHQVRHIMAVLLLVGAGMEKPSIVRELLNIEPGAYKKDLAWLRTAGIETSGEVALPGSTATETDGATAMTASPRLRPVSSPTGTPNAVPPVSTESQISAENLEQLRVYDTKPEYELSADRPLMLWECGFRPRDIQWRTGCFDGPINEHTLASTVVQRDLVKSASIVSSDIYRTCVKTAIDAEIARHFFLAAPSASTGTTPSGTLYNEARWPYLTVPTSVLQASRSSAIPATQHTPMNLPFGNGNFRPVSIWKGLASRKREDPVEVKNERWLLGKGKRRAEKKGTTAERLPTNGRDPL
ncbi:unnamed protein product [Parajaminaea phylloscopi]